MRDLKIGKVLAMDYRSLGARVLAEFRRYVREANEQALVDLKRRKRE